MTVRRRGLPARLHGGWDGLDIHYNAENQLITINKNNQSISEYGYDGDGQRLGPKYALPGYSNIYISEKLEPGTKFERNGKPDGYFASPLNTPFPQQSLSPEKLIEPLSKNEVIKSIQDVMLGPIAPWFGQPGGGIQYYFKQNIQTLLDKRYIMEIK